MSINKDQSFCQKIMTTKLSKQYSVPHKTRGLLNLYND